MKRATAKMKARTRSAVDLFGPECRTWERAIRKKTRDAMFYVFTHGMELVAYNQQTGERLGEFKLHEKPVNLTKKGAPR